MRPTTFCESIVKSILYPKFNGSGVTRWGQEKESIAIQNFELEKLIKVEPAGLFLHPDFPYLGASPDGLIHDDEKTQLLSLMKQFMADDFRVSFQNMNTMNVHNNIFNRDYVRFVYNHDGYVVDPTCAGIERLIEKAGLLYEFMGAQYWLFIDDMRQNDNDNGDSLNEISDKTEDTCIETLSQLGYKLFSNASIYPNSQVIWIQRSICTYSDSINNTTPSSSPYEITNLYALFDIYRISNITSLNATLIGIYTGNDTHLSEMLSTLHSFGDRRRNLHRISLRGGYVIQFEKDFTYMLDVHKRGTEAFLKRSYPLMLVLKEDLNFTTELIQTDGFGWDRNNSGIFDGGLMGQFQRKVIDISMHEIIMRPDRWSVSDFPADLIQVPARIIFRQPPLSSISNIYVLPFAGNVWISSAILTIFMYFIFMVQIRFNRSRDAGAANVRTDDVFTFTLGAICQQGFSFTPSTVSARITIFLLFLSSLFLFTSYSATIVALLQTPSTVIKTIGDLVDSPFAFGIQNLTYNSIFFLETKHPVARRLYERKLKPAGDKGILTPDIGMALVRRGMYAFQVDTGAGYDEISHTFTEDEKCDLAELELFRLPTQALPIARRSPYRDLFAIRLRWQREVGIQDRVFKIWVAQKPRCESTRGGGFVSVGITETKPAFKVIIYGSAVAFGLFIMELLYKNHEKITNKFLKTFQKFK